MSDWISAREASRRVRDADLTEGDLIEWARQGRLQARAQSGTFSDDDPHAVREFPKEPPSDEIERSALGLWPDIPKGFWKATPHKALWGPGTFAERVEYWEEYYQENAYEYIELFNVTFNEGELEALLNGPPAPTAKPQVLSARWQQQRVSQQQAAAFKFIDTALKFPPKDPLGPVARHRAYLEWHADPKNKLTGDPLMRTAFGKWENRYLGGWRDGDRSRWVHNR